MSKWNTLFLASLLLFGCNNGLSRKNEDPIILTPKISSPEQLTYKSIQASVLQKACLKCHSEASGNKGGVNLETYENVFKNSHQIRIEVSGGTMPPNEKLTNAQIKQTTDWIDAGASENGKTAGEIPTVTPTPQPVPTPIPTPTPVKAPLPEKISFETVFNQVIKTNCFKCHSAAGGNRSDINLENYENVFANRFEVKFQIETDQMPSKKGTPLTEVQKKLILAWIAQGSLN